MHVRFSLRAILVACLLSVPIAHAEDPPAQTPDAASAVERYRDGAQKVIDQALALVGIRYRRGGSDPATGFDCSGFVGHVFREGLGLVLPRSARAMSTEGTAVAKDELQPGDLVFFDTMRRRLSHVGIYLGDHLFIHAPRSGESIGIADLRDTYWARRYHGARRVDNE